MSRPAGAALPGGHLPGGSLPDGPLPGATVVWHPSSLSRPDRVAATGLRGATVWFTGLSGSGKSTVAHEVERRLVAAGRAAYVLDGDNLRHGLNADLGFDAAGRSENVRRVGEVARLFADAGVVALVPVISPYRADRDRARAAHTAAGLPFVEVHVATPLDVCEGRDPKGLYAKARRGEVRGFTGIDDPYEAPLAPELVLDTSAVDVVDASSLVLAALTAQVPRPVW